MANDLVQAGHHVIGFDLVDSAKDVAAHSGIKVVESVAEAVRDADVVFTMLPASAHVRSVLPGPDGVLAYVRSGTLIVDSSTIEIEIARGIARDGLR